ncbi:XrtA/PEP-CTERM system-associated ATPase [Piscinibacter koreensis]|uniref:AAA family ATPase n=1 Tax=Piscinibacter koreensis TaxID=2742824 RepID=A0A7Y6NL77_9BURK|nr:XrtA/PEP-CTERM system-associated ATPase [Schlegelella koreensis]NUZ05137.1 AAA family ATPase [Schlegelella koreensis]
MYEAFYGLSSRPFQLNPDPHFYFGSKQHSRAKAYLEYGVSRNDGFIVITGEIGAGKTTMLRRLLESLAGTNIVVGQVVTTQLDAEDTLRMVGTAFGVPVQGLSKSDLLSRLEGFLVAQTAHGKRCLLIVDEAQNLTPRAVEELRMLSNFQLGNQSLLQTFLVGQPEFREILQRPEMEQLRQRVAATCHIGPLDVAETEAYVTHRLHCAGSTTEPTFGPGVFEALHAASGGIPRRINSICDRVLLLGFMEDRKHLTAEDVAEVVRDFAAEAKLPETTVRARPRNGTRVDLDVTRTDSWHSSTATNGRGSDFGELPTDPDDDAQRDARLHRIEQCMLRLESVNLHTLATLQELVQAIADAKATTR